MAGSQVQVGVVLKGKYRIDRELGAGGMGYVLAALHLDLHERVAIKFLLPEIAGNAEVVERFLREARAALRIQGEHVARVMDIDRLDDGTPFIVMEYLEGHDLSRVRQSRTPLPIGHAVDYVVQACAALAEAHRLGIVHRDLKPANLFLTRRRDGSACVKVLDFGISKLGMDGDASVTKTNSVMGTAEYMSPEQMRSSRDVDGRADLWALGVVLYELCTAQVPFPGETITQVCARVFTELPIAPRVCRPDLPEELEAAILRCLEKNRDRRFANVEELVRAIAPFGAKVLPRGPAAPLEGTMPSGAAIGVVEGWPSLASPDRPSLGEVESTLPVVAAAPAIEAIARSASEGSVAALSGAQGPSTTAVVSSDHFPEAPATASPRGRSTVRAAAVVALAVAGVAVVAFGLRSSAGGRAQADRGPAAEAPLALPSVLPSALPSVVPSAPQLPSSAAPPVVAVTVEPTASSSALAPSASASPKKLNGAPARATAAAPPPAPTGKAPSPGAAGCDPPYVLDANGLKHMKAQCL